MLRWLFDHVSGISGWLATFQGAGQLVFVAVITSFFTACVTEPVKQIIAEHRRRHHWRKFVYQELAAVYAMMLWELDTAILTASIGGDGEPPPEAAADAALEKRVREPYLTPRFDIAKIQTEFYELPEANTIEQLYTLVSRTYGSKQDQPPLPHQGYHYQVRQIVTEFRRCLFPDESDWAWERNAFRVPRDRPLNAVLFYRSMRRQDLKKERWALRSSNRVSGVLPYDYRDGDGIYSKSELLLFSSWERGLFRLAMHVGVGLRKLLMRTGFMAASEEPSNEPLDRVKRGRRSPPPVTND